MTNKNKLLLLLAMLVVTITGCGGQVSSSSTASTPGGTDNGALYTGNAVLSWNAPTQYSDGSPLLASDITGYKVYFGTSSRAYASNHMVPASTTSIRIRDLNVPTGSFYVAVSTLDKAGHESDYSSEVSATLN
jgi:hypothetical protein